RSAAAEGIAAVGPSAGAEAAKKLAAAVGRDFPADSGLDYRGPAGFGLSYWRALARLGKAAAEPTAGLLKHGNWYVRAMALRTLGELGPSAKDELPRIRD